MQPRLRFLGTGASGGTPGRGRSGRRESSLLVELDGFAVLLDVTRQFAPQAEGVQHIDAVLLTHGHRDASGGIAQLRRWWLARSGPPIPVCAAPETIALLRSRFRRLDHCRFVPVRPGRSRRCGPWSMSALPVPHALEAHVPTYAWRLSCPTATIVYASDVGRLTPELERFSRGAEVLVLDGAMWQRRLFSHLTIDRALPVACRWTVGRILLTQIGRSAPLHEALERAVRGLCPRALPAYDGLELLV